MVTNGQSNYDLEVVICTFDCKILNIEVSYGLNKLKNYTDYIALAYIENTGLKDRSGSITYIGYVFINLLDLNKYYPEDTEN